MTMLIYVHISDRMENPLFLVSGSFDHDPDRVGEPPPSMTDSQNDRLIGSGKRQVTFSFRLTPEPIMHCQGNAPGQVLFTHSFQKGEAPYPVMLRQYPDIHFPPVLPIILIAQQSALISNPLVRFGLQWCFFGPVFEACRPFRIDVEQTTRGRIRGQYERGSTIGRGDRLICSKIEQFTHKISVAVLCGNHECRLPARIPRIDICTMIQQGFETLLAPFPHCPMQRAVAPDVRYGCACTFEQQTRGQTFVTGTAGDVQWSDSLRNFVINCRIPLDQSGSGVRPAHGQSQAERRYRDLGGLQIRQRGNQGFADITSQF
ncbi:MAG: hypothetical protein R3E82_03940 [Pseudomonadales bacterium]